MKKKIPRSVIALVADVISKHFTGTRINHLFDSLDIEPPFRTGGSKYEKVQAYLEQANKDDESDPITVLGNILEEFMDRDIAMQQFSACPGLNLNEFEQTKSKVHKKLAKHGFHYLTGGSLVTASFAIPSAKVENFVKDRNLVSLDDSFKRLIRNVNDDPPAALDAACSLVESFCRHYIEEHPNLQLPPSKQISKLYKIVQVDLGLDPAEQSEDDIKKILSGLTSIVHGLGAFRTHAGAAHGKGAKPYRVLPRHSRLVLHAAQTFINFAIETWIARENKATS